MKNQDTSLEAQRKRMLAWLKHRPLSTIEARDQLEILHPSGRVFELRKLGIKINTAMLNKHSAGGVVHRVGIYTLQETTE